MFRFFIVCNVLFQGVPFYGDSLFCCSSYQQFGFYFQYFCTATYNISFGQFMHCILIYLCSIVIIVFANIKRIATFKILNVENVTGLTDGKFDSGHYHSEEKVTR